MLVLELLHNCCYQGKKSNQKINHAEEAKTMISIENRV